MKTNNVLLLVGDNKESLESFESKLMLLRDLDTVLHSSFDEAFASCQANIPDSVIIFVEGEDNRIFELCKLIKADSILKNIPILFAMNEFNQEIALSGFDAGISDYISFPLSDSDVLIRVIWALQKSEDAKKIEKQEQLLSNLNVVYKNIGIYTQKYTQEVFKNEIDSAMKYKRKACLMAVSLDNDFQGVVPVEKLAAVIKKSTRNSDIIGLADKNTFLVMMPKTSSEGAGTVYKRIQTSLNEVTASASAVEYDETMSYSQMNDFALSTLEKSLNQINTLITYDPELDSLETEELLEEMPVISLEEQLQEVMDEPDSNDEEVLKQKDYKLFVQAFNKKIENLVRPSFESAKASYLPTYEDNVKIDIISENEKCIFIFSDDLTQNKAVLSILNEGLSKVLVDVDFIRNGQRSNSSQKIELKELNESYILNLLEKVNSQFKGFINVQPS